MLPGIGDLAIRQLDQDELKYEYTHSTCEVCGESKHVREMVGEFPNPGWRECRLCHTRLHPMCACGCGRFASIIADVRWPGGVDCRAPWVDIEHALHSVTLHTTERASIDVILDENDLPRILSLVEIGLSPCWCDIEAMTCFHGYEYQTRLPWCPQHGAKE